MLEENEVTLKSFRGKKKWDKNFISRKTDPQKYKRQWPAHRNSGNIVSASPS